MDALSRPVATVNDIVRQGHELVALREENARLRQERDHLLAWAGRRPPPAGREHRPSRSASFRAARRAGFVTARIVADTAAPSPTA